MNTLRTGLRAPLSLVAPALLTLALFSGCTTTHQARNVDTSGFLNDYSRLREGSGDEALLIYVNPAADFRQYRRIWLEPIAVYPGIEKSELNELSREDLQRILNYFDATIRQNLSDRYAFVTEPGADVMRFRIALTEADSANRPIDLVSSILPPGIALNMLKTIATGRGTGIGQVSVEFEALDSTSGERLSAAVDMRIGNKYTGRFDKFNEWRAIQGSADYWAERLKQRLDEFQAQSAAAR